MGISSQACRGASGCVEVAVASVKAERCHGEGVLQPVGLTSSALVLYTSRCFTINSTMVVEVTGSSPPVGES